MRQVIELDPVDVKALHRNGITLTLAGGQTILVRAYPIRRVACSARRVPLKHKCQRCGKGFGTIQGMTLHGIRVHRKKT